MIPGIIYISFYILSLSYYLFYVRKYDKFTDDSSILNFNYDFIDWCFLLMLNLIPFLVIMMTRRGIPSKEQILKETKSHILELNFEIQQYTGDY